MMRTICCTALGLLLLSACTKNPEQIESNAQKLLKEQKGADAEIEFRKVLQIEPNRASAHLGLGEALLQSGKVEEAAVALREAARIDPKGVKQRLLLVDILLSADLALEGRDFLQAEAGRLMAEVRKLGDESYDRWRLEGSWANVEKKWEVAAECFRKAMEKSPQGKEVARLALAQALVRNGQAEEAEKVLVSRLQEASSWGEGYDALYAIRFNAKQMQEALEVLERKQRATGDEIVKVQIARHYALVGNSEKFGEVLESISKTARPEVHIAAGGLLRSLKRWDEALSSFRRAEGKDEKTSFEAEKLRINTLMEAGRWEEGKNALQEARKKHPEEIDLALLSGKVLAASGRAEEQAQGRREIEELSKKHPENAAVRYEWGQILRKEGKLGEAASQFREALKLDKTLSKARAALAEIALVQNNGAEASRLAEEIVRDEPGSRSGRMLSASGAAQLGRLAEARKGFEELLSEKADDGEVQLRLAYVLLAERKAEAAESMFQKLYREGQEDLRPVVGLTQALVLGKKEAKALAVLGKEIEVRKDKAALMAMRGELALGAGMMDLAWQIGQERLRLEPKSPSVRSFLGDVLLSKGDREGAARELATATELAPTEAFFWKKLAFLQQMKKNAAEAERCYRKSLELDGKQADAKNNLANLLVDLGKNLEEAERLARGAISEAPDRLEYQDTLGWVLLKQGKKEEALRRLGDLAIKRPEDASIRYHHGTALAADGQNERGRREMAEALKKNMDPALRQEIQQAMEKMR